nr:MAG TPA: hypothetical protein [Caudoviricetes sp.]
MWFMPIFLKQHFIEKIFIIERRKFHYGNTN